MKHTCVCLACLLYMASLTTQVVGQSAVILKEHRLDQQKSSIFVPSSPSDSDQMSAIRAAGAYSWAVAPVIAQSWDKQVKGMGLIVRIAGQAAPPTAIVFVVDGKATMISDLKWQKDAGGGQATLVDREGLVRSVAAARDVSITVFGTVPLSATFHSEDLSVFRSVASMYDVGVFSEPLGASQPAVQGALPKPVAQDDTARPTAKMESKEPPPAQAALSAAPITLIPPPAQPKLDRKDYLQSKVSEAGAMCHDQIVATSKDPSSVQFADQYSYGLGRALSRNWIFITWPIMGRNTYGAVLRHTMTCTISCVQGKPCTLINLEDDPS